MSTGAPTPPARNTTAAKAILVIGLLVTIVGSLWIIATMGSDGKPSPVNAIVAGALTALGGGIIGASIQDLISRASLDRGLSAVTQSVSVAANENTRLLDAATAQITSIAEEMNTSVKAAHTSIETSLRTSLTAQFISSEQSLRPIRKTWHHYHVTVAGRELRWLYAIFPFDACTGTASINTPINLVDLASVKHVYNAEAGIRTERLFVNFTRADGTEPSCSEIFPQIPTFRDTHSGIGIRQTWDGTHLLARAIMSEHPLIPGIAPGMIDAEHNFVLDDAWAAGFSLHKIHLSDLPRQGTDV